MSWFKKKDSMVLENAHYKITVEPKDHSLDVMPMSSVFYTQDGRKYMAFDGFEINSGEVWYMYKGCRIQKMPGANPAVWGSVVLSINGLEGRVKLCDN